MTQQQIDELVAKVTGEEIRNIRRHGFSIVEPELICFDPEPDLRPPQFIDWDQLDRERFEHADVRR